MAGLQNFQIILENPDKMFAPGDTVVGRVIIELSKTKRIKVEILCSLTEISTDSDNTFAFTPINTVLGKAYRVKIKFKGSAEVHWSESSGTGNNRKTRWYRNSEDYFRQEYYLLGGLDNVESVEIESGSHVFPFTFSLPRDIPSNFESLHGNVKYSIKASINRPWKFDHKAEVFFNVQTPYDLSIIPAAELAIQDEETKQLGCFPCVNGTISATISIPKSGYAIGEIIHTTVALNNESSVPVTKIKLKIIQKITLYSHTSTKRDVKIIDKAKIAGPFNKTSEVMFGMLISPTPPSGFPHCTIIDIQYSLAIKVVIFGYHRSIQRVYPILIGTKSSSNSFSMNNAHATVSQTNAQLHETKRSTDEKPPPSYDSCMKTESQD